MRPFSQAAERIGATVRRGDSVFCFDGQPFSSGRTDAPGKSAALDAIWVVDAHREVKGFASKEIRPPGPRGFMEGFSKP